MNYACVKSDNEIYWSPVPKPEKCQYCTGNGYIVRETTKTDIGCCGRPNRDGSCCGNGVPVENQDWEPEPCQPCNAIPYDDTLKAFEDGLTVKYEDQEAIKMLMTKATGYVANDEFFSLIFFNERFKPGTCVPIDVKGEVVEEWATKVDSPLWYPVMGNDAFGKDKSKVYRKVFRITK